MNRLKELRKEKRLTQQELAKQTHTSYRSIQNWENLERPVSDYNIETFSKFFNCTSDYFLCLSDERDAVVLLPDQTIIDKSELEKYKHAYDLLNGLRGFLNE